MSYWPQRGYNKRWSCYDRCDLLAKDSVVFLLDVLREISRTDHNRGTISVVGVMTDATYWLWLVWYSFVMFYGRYDVMATTGVQEAWYVL